MWTRGQLKSNAKINMQRNYWGCVAVAFIMSVAEGIGAAGGFRSGARSSMTDDSYSSYESYSLSDMSGALALAGTVLLVIGLMLLVFGILLNVFVGNVLRVGANKFFVQNRTEAVRVGTIFDGFRSGQYKNIVLTMFLKDLYVTLWTFLLIIPGIIKELEYMMVPYILAENPGMNQKEAFEISKRMMDGEKLNAFVLQLSFIGWYLLAAITCGLAGIFYVNPYVEATMTELYAYNKGKAFHEGYIQ
jgi:uncharacterized membrane protein